jgi:hypothetical protein
MPATEKKGDLFIVKEDGKKSRNIGGMPDVGYGGQGGLGDVASLAISGPSLPRSVIRPPSTR